MTISVLRDHWLIQPCQLRVDGLKYHEMHAAIYEMGNQHRSLGRIFSQGIVASEEHLLIVDGVSISVYMVAGNGFPFGDYMPHLQSLVKRKTLPIEECFFEGAAKVVAGVSLNRSLVSWIDVWFDFQNDVLWTLTPELKERLVIALNEKKEIWFM